MNKKLKIAVAAVSVVMAGTMAFGMFGCANTPEPTPGPGDNTVTVEGNTYGDLQIPSAKATTNAAEIVSKLNDTTSMLAYINAKNNAWTRLKNSNGSASGTSTQVTLPVASSYPSTTVLNMDVGDNNRRGVAFNTDILSDSVTLPDGDTYGTTALKPAWKSLASTLNLSFNNKYSDKGTTSKTDVALGKDTVGDRLWDRDIITEGVETINLNSSHFLDLSKYLDEMPNYKKFLDEYPVVKLSLTSDVNTGAMYAAPYFDGNDDIEKYVLCKINWVESLLDAEAGDTTTTFKSHAEAKQLAATTYASIQSFMGTKGSFNVDGLDKEGKKLANGIDVNYDKVLEAAKSDTTPLGAAIKAATGDIAYSSKEGAISGNIVDIMNFAINYSHGECTGAQLLKIMQEYIKVAYYVGGTTTPMYTQTGYKLSDVFTGHAAAWDVDLYAALGRCLVTNPSLIKSGSSGNTIGGVNATPLSNLYLVANRQGNMQRMIDTTSFVGELYGVRGLEARNLYSYIDAKGNLQDPRGDYESYDAFNAFSKFYAEGLATEKGNSGNAQTSFYVENSVEALSYHDYSNTQTPGGFQTSGIISGTYALEDGYNFTSILTPVSKWNTKSEYDATTHAPKYDTYMRFTESWRSVKNTGFAVPYKAVEGNPEKLAAVLKFIDYIFSDEGQIELSYGPMASDADSTGGFWFNPEATQAQIDAGQYFEYKGKKYYSDVYYAGKYQPKVTDKVKSLYYGNEVNGVKVTGAGGFNSKSACARNYTDFARYVIGSALPIGNKLQSFEYQMTSQMGLAGADVVNTALEQGVIQHVVLDIKGKDNNPWYASTPTLLPYTNEEKSQVTAADLVSDFAQNKYFSNNSKTDLNLYWEIIKYGYDASSYAALFNNIGLTKSV